jgi:N-acylglucosamine 2-epimerase
VGQEHSDRMLKLVKRRTILRSLSVAGAAEAVLLGFRPTLRGASAQQSGAESSPQLAGYTLPQIRDLYYHDLFVDWLPFMARYVIDREYGGFLCNTDFDGRHVNFEKNPLFEGRGIWVYSYLYTHFGKDSRYLEVARRSVGLLGKSQPRNGELWCTKIARDGTPLTPPGALIPTDLGIAEGFAAYAQATGQQEYLDQAKQLLRKCVEAYDRADYYPQLGQHYLGLAASEFPGPRILGSWMILLRTATQILEAAQDPYTDQIARRATDAVIQHHFNPEFRLNNELLNHDLSRPAGAYAQLVNLGNTFEITWMLLDESMRRRDEALFDLCSDRFQRHAAVGWDQVYDGVFHALLNVDENRFLLNKLLWAQVELLTDSLYIYARRRAAWAGELFGRMYSYLRGHYPLKAHSSPLWMYSSGRKATFEEFAVLPKRVENYHHPRQLMLNLRRLQGMIAAQSDRPESI